MCIVLQYSTNSVDSVPKQPDCVTCLRRIHFFLVLLTIVYTDDDNDDDGNYHGYTS